MRSSCGRPPPLASAAMRPASPAGGSSPRERALAPRARRARTLRETDGGTRARSASLPADAPRRRPGKSRSAARLPTADGRADGRPSSLDALRDPRSSATKYPKIFPTLPPNAKNMSDPPYLGTGAFLWHRLFANPPLKCVKMPLSQILDFYRRLAILSPGEVVAKTKQCCKLHCYVRYQAYFYVPPQTLMKVSCESGRGIRAEIQTFRLSPKLARGSLGGPERLYLGPDPPSTLTANLH